MNRMLSLALIAALAGVPMMTGPAQAGGFTFDLPNLTWPTGTGSAGADATQSGQGVVLGTKSAKKG